MNSVFLSNFNVFLFSFSSIAATAAATLHPTSIFGFGHTAKLRWQGKNMLFWILTSLIIISDCIFAIDLDIIYIDRAVKKFIK